MWTFNNSTGELLDPSGDHVETGYAGGAAGARPEAVNNPEYQYTKGVGPLPVGLYLMEEAVEGSHLGPLAIPLTPDSANDMRGRGDFYIHGDHIGKVRSASDGCIIMSHGTRQALVANVDKHIRVVSA